MIFWRPPTWNNPQRKALLGLLCVLTAFLSIRLYFNPVYLSDPQPSVPQRAADVEDRIDPNSADAHMLAALPLIAQKRAEDIVAYRERFVVEHPGRVAFSTPEDLRQVRGIGTATLAQLQPYLVFPPHPSATTAAGR